MLGAHRFHHSVFILPPRFPAAIKSAMAHRTACNGGAAKFFNVRAEAAPPVGG
jgi:hypothetical protein